MPVANIRTCLERWPHARYHARATMGAVMRDKTLVVLVLVATFLFAAHNADHIARGDLRWPLTVESIPFLVVLLLVFAVIAGGLYLYRQGKVGPRFCALLVAVSVALGWLGHFSPFTDQPPQYIFHAYRSAAAGWLAVGTLVALMLSLIAVTIYAGVLWARGASAAPLHSK